VEAVKATITALNAEITRAESIEALCEKTANKGTANGYASIDSTGHIPINQIPQALQSSIFFAGLWNASTNTPALSSGAGYLGQSYKVSVAGSTLIDGNSTWHAGDWIIFDGSIWDKIDNFESVTSVAGRVGAITLANTDISGLGTASTHAATDFDAAGSAATVQTNLTAEVTRATNAEGLLAPQASPSFTGTLTAPVINADTLTTTIPPVLGATPTTASTGGTFAGNTTFYYRVSAQDSVGTTLISNEVSKLTSTGTATNTITITWSAIPTAVSYKVFRGTASNTEQFIATVASPTTTYTDTGSITPSGAMPTVATTGNIVANSVGVLPTNIGNLANNFTGTGMANGAWGALQLYVGGIASLQISNGAITQPSAGGTPNGQSTYTIQNNTSHPCTLGVTGNGYSTAPYSADQSFIAASAYNAGGLLLLSPGAYPIVFATNNVETARLSATGGWSVGTKTFNTTDPGAGNVSAQGSVKAAKLNLTLTTPASSSAAGNAGDMVYDANYIYVCTGASHWRRVALTDF
jgi:hypothetical protein